MQPIRIVTGVAAPLLRANIDTDTIIPSREMKHVSKEGLAEGLFAGWRYLSAEARDPNPEFVLNQSPYDTACILMAGRNFGCGSSREQAVWALKEWGIRSVIAPGFGAIFQSNCVRNGLLPVVLDEAAVDAIADAVQSNPLMNLVAVDLYSQHVTMGERFWTFKIGSKDRLMLLEGLDAIAVTLKDEPEIAAFEVGDRHRRPWAYL